MKTNVKPNQPPILTHEGGKAHRINAEQQLRRSLMSCFLWEKTFYEDGQEIAKRLANSVPLVAPAKVAAMAVEAREQMKLRHAPLFLVREMARHETHRPYVADTLAKVIQRADEPMEFMAMYWAEGKVPVAHCVRDGLAQALRKFDAYALAKYDRQGSVSLKDVFRIVRPEPDNADQAELWRQAVKGELPTPDTWEVELSRNDGVSKLNKWTRLLVEKKLGALALLRNLRNMQQAGVHNGTIMQAIHDMSIYRVLPFRFIAAAREVPQLEPALEEKFFEAAGELKLAGKTVILVDMSGSMRAPLSAKSDMERTDAACGVAMVGREMCDDVEVWSFADKAVLVPPRRGFALRDAIEKSNRGGTYLANSLKEINAKTKYDRIIVITDEQTHDGILSVPKGVKGYLINVASYQNGVGYGDWIHIDGFSESVFRYIVEMEKAGEM